MKTNYDRQQIINALKRFDEGSKTDDLFDISTKKLFKRLRSVSEKTDFTANDLIEAAEKGF